MAGGELTAPDVARTFVSTPLVSVCGVRLQSVQTVIYVVVICCVLMEGRYAVFLFSIQEHAFADNHPSERVAIINR